jgi:4'-phosphopantetheinyl transferase
MIYILYMSFDTDTPDDRYPGLLEVMPAVVRNNIARSKRWQNRQAILYGRLLLTAGLKLFDSSFSCEGLSNMEFSEHGRPYLEGRPDFNISHSGGCVVCAVSDTGKVGIDVERIREIKTADFYRYMPEACLAANDNPAERLALFYDCWTMKESAVKADGRGISIGLGSVRLEGGRATVNGSIWFLKDIFVADGYKCHLASPLEHPEIRTIAVTSETIGTLL